MSLYERVIAEARSFLGGATERFIERQCRSHLKTEPQALTAAQLPELAKWVEHSAALLLPKPQVSLLRQKIEGLA